jgi:hypothetical protein
LNLLIATVTDAINVTMAVIGTAVAVLTYVASQRDRRQAVAGRAPTPTDATSLVSGETAAPPHTRLRQSRTHKATISAVLGAWGLLIVVANQPRAADRTAGDFAFGILLAIAAMVLAALALIAVHSGRAGRGGTLAWIGGALGAAALVTALAAR